MTTAVILVPALHVVRYASECFDYCALKGYAVAGLTKDWAAAAATFAGVVVVARPDHLDPNREPRVEVVGAATPEPNSWPLAARRRRPHLI